MIEEGVVIRVETSGDVDQVRGVNNLAFGQPAEAALV
jgi:predicted N-acetyltransferase YhbS